MSDINHRRVHANGIWMHIAEKGQGPLVLLIHGFPELWSCWKYQINHLAEHGYHVVAPDMRGYGDSGSPQDPESYTIFHLVGCQYVLKQSYSVGLLEATRCTHSRYFLMLSWQNSSSFN